MSLFFGFGGHKTASFTSFSLVSRGDVLWEQEVPGSNPGAPTLFCVYIIYSQRLQRYYVGSAEVVERRLQEHNRGKSVSTRAGIPWELIRTESFPTRSKALFHERKIKARGIGRYLSDLDRNSSG